MKGFVVKPTTRLMVSLLSLLAISLGDGGCAGKAGGITLTSLRTHQSYIQGFSDAYISKTIHGDLDILLIDDAAAQALAGYTPASPVRQIMHLRVLWQPDRDLKVTDAAASNASIHWYVINGQAGAMEYTGTAFVTTSTFSGLTRVVVENAQVHPLCNCPGLTDPVGPSKVDGAVFAQVNPEAVAALLAQVRTSVAAASGRSTPSVEPHVQ
jgi:hypothetical protein